MGFEPTTPGLKDRDRLSLPTPPRHGGASFVSENCHTRPVPPPFVPGLVAQHGYKMATSAERLIILLERYHIDSGPAGASLDGQGAGVVNVYR